MSDAPLTSNLVAGCAHTILAFKIENGITRWHCANCLRGFNPSGDTEVERQVVKLRAALEDAVSKVRQFIGTNDFDFLYSMQDCTDAALSSPPDLPLTRAPVGLSTEQPVETTGEPTPHGVVYDKRGWVCSVCGGWNVDLEKFCQHPHGRP